jgi:hypothetical protein
MMTAKTDKTLFINELFDFLHDNFSNYPTSLDSDQCLPRHRSVKHPSGKYDDRTAVTLILLPTTFGQLFAHNK